MSGVDTRRRVAAANRWREQYNPLRNLTIARAVSMFEAAQRGEYADLQWTYRFIERRDADLMALIERRGNALLQMDWNIRQVDEASAAARGIPFDPDLAERQAGELRAAYERVDNIYEAIEHLALAVFREYAICQFQAGDQAALPGRADRIECLNPWNILRDGQEGDWYWNPEAKQTGVSGLAGSGQKIDPRYAIIREWPRPLNEIAILKFIRSNLSQKDWDGFVEIYGIPGVLVTMPENIPQGKEGDYKTAAEDVAEGKSGALPAGASAVVMDQPRGVNPFRDHLQYLTEKLVLAGTGGLLTMLSAPGSGTLAGSAHTEAFDIVARGEARKIGELFQRQFDRPILDAMFPGRPRLAYFDLAANEEQDVGAIIGHAVSIAQAGGRMDWSELSEKTGYTITAAPPAPQPAPGFPLANRSVSAFDVPTAAEIRAAITGTIPATDRRIKSRAYVQILQRNPRETPLVIVRYWEFGRRLTDNKPGRVVSDDRFSIHDRGDLTNLLVLLKDFARFAHVTLSEPPSTVAVNSDGTRPLTSDLRPLTSSERVAEALSAAGQDALAEAMQRDLKPVAERLATVLAEQDPDALYAGLAQLRRDLPALLKQLAADPAAAGVLEGILSAALLNGWAEAAVSHQEALQ